MSLRKLDNFYGRDNLTNTEVRGMEGEEGVKEKMDQISEDVLREIVENLEGIIEAWERGNASQLMTHLLSLAENLREASPQIAPILGALIEKYGIALVPFVDELVKLGIEASKYYFEKSVEIGEAIAPYVEKYEEMRAKMYAIKRRSLQKAGFSKKEAMNILLTEIGKASQAKQNSFRESFLDLLKNITTKEEKE